MPEPSRQSTRDAAENAASAAAGDAAHAAASDSANGATPDRADVETFHSYPIQRATWMIAGEAFELIWPADMDALLDDERTRERFRRDEYMPYWGTPWPASALLAEYVLTQPRSDGGRAIEVGCGIGLVALAAARAGWRVVAGDYDLDALAFARENARRNGLALADAVPIDWREPWSGERFALVLASDVLYERRHAEPVARWIAAALAPGGTALVSDPDRSAAAGFEAIARAAGFSVVRAPREIFGPHGLTIRGTVYRLTRPHADG